MLIVEPVWVHEVAEPVVVVTGGVEDELLLLEVDEELVLVEEEDEEELLVVGWLDVVCKVVVVPEPVSVRA